MSKLVPLRAAPGLPRAPLHPIGSLMALQHAPPLTSPLFINIFMDKVLLSLWRPQTWYCRNPMFPIRKWGSEKVPRV